MGSFIGHIDEAVFFLFLATWWAVMTFPKYIKSIHTHTQYTNRLSYGLPCQKNIPVEAIMKTLFTMTGFIAELVRGVEGHFYDSQGNFHKLSGMQHLSIYGIFFIHSILDLLTCCKVKAIPPGSDYMSLVAALVWYGLSFTFHAAMPGKPPVEKLVHILPTYVIFLLAVVILFHFYKRNSFLLDLGRTWCVLVLATWFVHTSFIMYIPWGSTPNPLWDQQDVRNGEFLVAAFGAHCCLHFVTITLLYGMFYFLLGRKTTGRKPYEKCPEVEAELLGSL